MCRCDKPIDYYTNDLRVYKTCSSCRDYQRIHRPPYDKMRQREYSRNHYLRRVADKSFYINRFKDLTL